MANVKAKVSTKDEVKLAPVSVKIVCAVGVAAGMGVVRLVCGGINMLAIHFLK